MPRDPRAYLWDAVTTKLPGLRRTLDALLSELS
jgi:hypothetical protein